jgi:hypothetical protein
MSSALVSPVAGNPANVSPVLMFHFFPIAAAAGCAADEQAFIFASELRVQVAQLARRGPATTQSTTCLPNG